MAFFEESTDAWTKIAERLKSAKCVFITAHVNPDGDAIGSEIALARFLDRMGVYNRIINHSPTPDSFSYLDPDNRIEQFSGENTTTIDPGADDVIVMLDMGRYDRCGSCSDYFKDNSAVKIVIDHHPPEKIDADIVLVNTRAASTGSLVYDLLNFIDPSLIDKDIAMAVITAVATDTGYFRYGNTTSTTHRIAASLYDHGVNVLKIRRRLETGYPFCRQKLMGAALSNLKTTHSDRIAHSFVTLDMFNEAGAKREHTDGIIDQIRMIKHTEIVFLVIQEAEGRYKVSFRSGDKVSVNVVASMLGGGGHPRAAGANLIGSLKDVTSRVLDAAESYLESKDAE